MGIAHTQTSRETDFLCFPASVCVWFCAIGIHEQPTCIYRSTQCVHPPSAHWNGLTGNRIDGFRESVCLSASVRGLICVEPSPAPRSVLPVPASQLVPVPALV